MIAPDIQNLRTQLAHLRDSTGKLIMTEQQSIQLLHILKDMEERAFSMEKEIYGSPSIEAIAGIVPQNYGGNVVSIFSHQNHPHHQPTGDIA